MTKPHIRKITPYLFGIKCAPCWICESPEEYAFGHTPKEAYDTWAAAIPKTRIGRALTRLLNRIVDAFL